MEWTTKNIIIVSLVIFFVLVLVSTIVIFTVVFIKQKDTGPLVPSLFPSPTGVQGSRINGIPTLVWTPPISSNATLIGYNIYKNGSTVPTTIGLTDTYADTSNTVTGPLTYKITALYLYNKSQNESLESTITIPEDKSTTSSGIYYYFDVDFCRFFIDTKLYPGYTSVGYKVTHNGQTTVFSPQVNSENEYLITPLVANDQINISIIYLDKEITTGTLIFTAYIPPSCSNGHYRLRFYNFRTEDIWVQFTPGGYTPLNAADIGKYNYNCLDTSSTFENNKYKVLEQTDSRCEGYVQDQRQQFTNSPTKENGSLFPRFGDRKTNQGFASLNSKGQLVLEDEVVYIPKISSYGLISFHDYCIPDAGMLSTNFKVRAGCAPNDSGIIPKGVNCRIGDSTDYSVLQSDYVLSGGNGYIGSLGSNGTKNSMAVDTLFEASFGCVYTGNDTLNCNVNISGIAAGTDGTPYIELAGSVTYFDLSAVDGFTIPMKIKIRSMDGKSDNVSTCLMSDKNSKNSSVAYDGKYDCSNLSAKKADGTPNCPEYEFLYYISGLKNAWAGTFPAIGTPVSDSFLDTLFEVKPMSLQEWRVFSENGIYNEQPNIAPPIKTTNAIMGPVVDSNYYYSYYDKVTTGIEQYLNDTTKGKDQGNNVACISPGKILVYQNLFGGLKPFICQVSQTDGSVNLCSPDDFSVVGSPILPGYVDESYKITSATSLSFGDGQIATKISEYRQSIGKSAIDPAQITGLASYIGQKVYEEYTTWYTSQGGKNHPYVDTVQQGDCKAYTYAYDDFNSLVNCDDSGTNYRKYEVMVMNSPV